VAVVVAVEEQVKMDLAAAVQVEMAETRRF
jgi:hypothetical protein